MPERRKIDKRHEKRAESLQAVDDLVAGVVGKLREQRRAGQHLHLLHLRQRLPRRRAPHTRRQKWRPYEEDVRMPLLVRGPGVAAGSTSQQAGPQHRLPAHLHGPCGRADARPYVDGRSLGPVLKGNATTWRSAVLLEAHHAPREHPCLFWHPHQQRTKYVEYAGGKRELYYLGPRPLRAQQLLRPYPTRHRLVSRLQALKSCAGVRCRAAENGP